MTRRGPITPEVAAEIAAELRRLHPVKYAALPPGEDASVDAYNLLIAALGGQEKMARAIIDHQLPHGDLEPLLTLFSEGIASASHPLYLERLRLVAEERADARMAEIRGES
jgi:hypothetical protein